MRERLLAASATPQVLVALLLLIGALALLLAVPRRPAPERTVIDLGTTEATTEQEATLVVVDEVGLERAATVRLQLPAAQSPAAGTARLTAVLVALRERSMQQGVWPPELPTPLVFLLPASRGTVAVIDMQVPESVGVSVEKERALHRSLVATAQQNGASEVRFLVNGRPADTLLGHVAVASEID